MEINIPNVILEARREGFKSNLQYLADETVSNRHFLHKVTVESNSFGGQEVPQCIEDPELVPVHDKAGDRSPYAIDCKMKNFDQHITLKYD